MVNCPVLDAGTRHVTNVGGLDFGRGALDELPRRLRVRRDGATRMGESAAVVYIVDGYFESCPEMLARIGAEPNDRTEFVSAKKELTTERVDDLVDRLHSDGYSKPAVVIGMGGGTTLDTAKAVSNLLTNGGEAEAYQGWDLVKLPGVYKVAVPTISGTGAETTRTCVMTRASTGLKLGMNSDHTVFNHVILDPMLSETVPRDQYFYTGMDSYFHFMESMAGNYRNAMGDAYSREVGGLCRDVFLAEDMMSEESRERLMVASYLSGCAIATGYVGVLHPLSAGLSVVLGVPHCMANCIVMRGMKQFYSEAYDEFWTMAERQRIEVPENVARDLRDDQYRALYAAMIAHEKPLTNALGAKYRDVLTPEKVTALYQAM